VNGACGRRFHFIHQQFGEKRPKRPVFLHEFYSNTNLLMRDK